MNTVGTGYAIARARAPSWLEDVVRDNELTGLAFRVAFILDRQRLDGEGISHGSIARQLGVTTRGVQKAIDQLISRNYIAIAGERERGRPLRYRVVGEDERKVEIRSSGDIKKAISEAPAVTDEKMTEKNNSRALVLHDRGNSPNSEQLFDEQPFANNGSSNNGSLSVSTGAPGMPTAAKILFDQGVKLLTEGGGRTEAVARSLIGQWRRDFGEANVIAAISVAQRNECSEPVAYIRQVLSKNRNPKADVGGMSAAHGIAAFIQGQSDERP